VCPIHADSVFLRQLARAPSLDGLRETFAAAQDEVETQEERDALGETFADALRLFDLIQTSARREGQLTALFQTAVDLTSLTDLDETLAAICRRTRALLGTDAAWLTLSDSERGDTFMRMTDGITSEEFRTVRVPYGAGLAGLVAERAGPEVTDDYLDDPRFDHAPRIDGVVGIEGLRAIAGAPLLRGEEVIGVVMTGNRGARGFAQDEVALLESLAAHAAIALENARLFEESRRALSDLEAASERIRAQGARADRSLALHDRLMTVLGRGGTLQDVAETVVEVTGGSVRIVAADGIVLATAGASARPEDGAATDAELADAFATGRSIVDGDDAARFIVPMLVQSEPLGALIAHVETADGARPLLERSALAATLVLSSARADARAEQKLRGELLRDVLLSTSAPELGARAGLLGVDLRRPHVLAVAEPHESARRWARTRLAMLAAEHGGLAGTIENALVVAIPGDDPRLVAAQVSHALAGPAGEPPTVSASSVATGVPALRDAFAQALRAQRLMEALGRTGSTSTADDFGVLGVLLDGTSGESLRTFVEQTIGPLLERPDLLRTLEAYVEHQGRAPRAAAALHVHTNTMYQRVRRLDAVLGEQWRRPDELLQLHLALRLHRMAATPPGQ
jgi:hypothetical protein